MGRRVAEVEALIFMYITYNLYVGALFSFSPCHLILFVQMVLSCKPVASAGGLYSGHLQRCSLPLARFLSEILCTHRVSSFLLKVCVVRLSAAYLTTTMS